MKTKYLNYNQARVICAHYQHLVGSAYEKNTESNHIIQQVVIAPYSKILQWQFIRFVVRGIPVEQAVDINPNGRYDVLLLPQQERRALSFRSKSLRTYLEEQGVEFNPNLYSVLRSF